MFLNTSNRYYSPSSSVIRRRLEIEPSIIIYRNHRKTTASAAVRSGKNLPQSPQFSIENCGDCGKFLRRVTVAMQRLPALLERDFTLRLRRFSAVAELCSERVEGR